MHRVLKMFKSIYWKTRQIFEIHLFIYLIFCSVNLIMDINAHSTELKEHSLHSHALHQHSIGPETVKAAGASQRL